MKMNIGVKQVLLVPTVIIVLFGFKLAYFGDSISDYIGYALLFSSLPLCFFIFYCFFDKFRGLIKYTLLFGYLANTGVALYYICSLEFDNFSDISFAFNTDSVELNAFIIVLWFMYIKVSFVSIFVVTVFFSIFSLANFCFKFWQRK